MKQRTDVPQTATNDEGSADEPPWRKNRLLVNDQSEDKRQRSLSNLIPYEKGNSGNPAGRPKGARSRLSDRFLGDLAEHWQANGKQALQKAYEKNPVEYVRVVASLLPKNVAVDVDVKYERIERVIVPARTIEHGPLPIIEGTTSSVAQPSKGNEPSTVE